MLNNIKAKQEKQWAKQRIQALIFAALALLGMAAYYIINVYLIIAPHV